MLELWHARSNNLIDHFDSADEAEAVLREAMVAQGTDVLAATYMLRVDASGESHFIAEGQAIPAALKRLRNGEASVSVPAAPGRRIAE